MGRWRIGRRRFFGVQTIMMNRAAPEALLKFLLLTPPPSFIPPPLNPYNRVLGEVLMERNEDLEEAEMEERETEDGGEGSNIYDEQGIVVVSAEISLDTPIRLIENSTQCDAPFFIHSNAITATASAKHIGSNFSWS